jgi:UDP-N-acetylmuramate dehydrogenase
MDIHTNISLKDFTTMRLGGNARFMAEATTNDEVATIYKNAKSQKLPVFVIGGGSNIIARDEGFDGVIIHMRIPGFQVIADNASSMTIKIGAGESWDEVVRRTVEMDLCGIEAMSGIPGTAGASPVQNIGAYGQEVADTLISLEAYDTRLDSYVTLTREECKFSYRDSIFRSPYGLRYIICSITLTLSKNLPHPPFYESLQKYIDDNKISPITVKTIRDAVIVIRTNKLPNHLLMPNTGSFFKNAIIETWQLEILRKIDPNVPSFELTSGRYKVPTGWLIEKAGFKGQILHGIRVYEKNALVLINESASSYNDLALAREEIIKKIRDLFRIEIEQEPLEI